ncbi:MAG TPA: alpha/beta hydrolase [Pirellulales bacterium]
MFRPTDASDAPPAISGVEWVTFSVEETKREVVGRWRNVISDEMVESTLKSAQESLLESAINAALNLDDSPLKYDREASRGHDGARELERLVAADLAKTDAKIARSRAKEAESDARIETVSRPEVREETVRWRLHGALVAAPNPAERRAVALYFHGSKDCIDDCIPRLLKTAKRHNVTMMSFDYRGFGRSAGRPSESGLLTDARTARRYLAQRTGVEERSIVLIGSAFGTGVAVDLAAYDGCRGLILENAFTSLGDVADAQSPGWLRPSRFMQARFTSIYKIPKYTGPLLQCHGDANTVVPLENGKKLFAAAPGPKKFIAIPGGKHEDPPTREFKLAMEEFFQSLPPEAAPLAPPQEIQFKSAPRWDESVLEISIPQENLKSR